MTRAGDPSEPRQSDPRRTYASHLGARRASLATAVRQHITYGNLRVAVLALGLVALYAVFAHGVFPAWWLVAPLAAFLWVGGRLEHTVNARERFGRSVAFFERALARMNGQWAGAGGDTGERFLDDGHLYARDLDLFGPASLFERLNSARTWIGEETLAGWLKQRADPDVVRARQDAVRELAPRVGLREDLAVLGEDARTVVRAEALAAWAERPARLASRLPIWVWPLTVAGALAVAGLFVMLAQWFGVLQIAPRGLAIVRGYVLVLAAVCGSIAWRCHGEAAAILQEMGGPAHDLGLLSHVVGRLEAERFTAPRLAELRAGLDVDGQPASQRLARLEALMTLVDSRDHLLVRVIGPLLLWDLHLVYALERWRATSGPAVRRWLTATGEMEALASLAGYHDEQPDDVFPELTDGDPCWEGDGVGHPLLPEATMVPNDVALAGDLRVLVVSGSNMSGKSTLLRTMGVNTVLAQAGAPVRARRLRLTPLDIGASIRVQDSLQTGVSRFYAEISRLGDIMRRAERSPVLFLIDELLQGTNSHDRRIGAESIVRELVASGAIGLVTTHDLALAQVADALGPRGGNVYFEDRLEDGRLRFDYRMRPGVVQKSNAIALMRSVGLKVTGPS